MCFNSLSNLFFPGCLLDWSSFGVDELGGRKDSVSLPSPVRSISSISWGVKGSSMKWFSPPKQPVCGGGIGLIISFSNLLHLLPSLLLSQSFPLSLTFFFVLSFPLRPFFVPLLTYLWMVWDDI